MLYNKIKNVVKFVLTPWNTEKQSGRFWGTIILFLVIVFAVLIFQGIQHYTSKKEFCLKCHEMRFTYNWYKKSKHGGAGSLGISVECVDCHLPADPVGYFAVKARDGMKDLFIHIFRPIRTEEGWIEKKEELDEIARGGIENANCMKCHKEVKPRTEEGKEEHEAMDIMSYKCIDCHTDIFHIL